MKEVFGGKGDAQRLSVVAEPSPVMDDEYNDETKNEEEIEEEEQGCAIAIVGTGACPHCKRAKSALDKLGVKQFRRRCGRVRTRRERGTNTETLEIDLEDAEAYHRFTSTGK